jgi:hypothetical protein
VREFRIRCSSLGKIMTEPKSKSEGTLSVGAKTYIRELARADIFGVEKEISSKQMEKGTRVEDESIRLYNSVFFTNHTKNAERRTDEFLTGECDIAADTIIDIKSPWCIDTFPISVVDCVNPLYEWQLRGYMRLWDKNAAQVAYCLVDTPEDLIGYEQPEAHIVSHIADHLRVTVWDIERDSEKEARIVEKVKAAREHYAEVIAEFDRTHQA